MFLVAKAVDVRPLRYTPAGVPVIELGLSHESEVLEAGKARRIEMSLSAIALGDTALVLADTVLGTTMTIEGFLAPSRKGSRKLVLHIQRADRSPASAAQENQIGMTPANH